MPVTFRPKLTAARQREDGRWEVASKVGEGYGPPAGRPHCEHGGHDSEQGALACWNAFLQSEGTVYEIA